MAEQEQAPEGVSVEAHERVKTENSKLKEQLQEAQGQLEASRKVSKVEGFLRAQKVPEEDIPSRIELLSPHLTDIPVDQVDDALGSDKFKPLTAAPSTATADEGDEEGETTTTVSETPNGGFGGPSPAGDDKPPEQKKYQLKDPEIQELIRRNDRDGLKKLYDEDRIAAPVRNY